jgi:predicted transposase/invertase (TIGR01784 family)
MMKKKTKTLKPLESGPYAFALYDATFKHLMQDPEIALSFLRTMTGRNIVSINPVSTAIPALKKKGYTQRHMDFSCRCNDGRIFVAEVQLAKHNHWKERSVFYPAGAYINQLKKGDAWGKLCPVMAVNLLGFETGMIQDPGDFEILFQLVDSKRNVILPFIEILNIELPRVCLDDWPDGLLKGWFMLLLKSSELKEIPPYFDATLRKAIEMLKWENWSDDMRKRYHNNKFNRDDYSIVIEETATKAKTEGREEGREEGKVVGFTEGLKAIAKRMLGEKEPLDRISRLTGLSE